MHHVLGGATVNWRRVLAIAVVFLIFYTGGCDRSRCHPLHPVTCE